MKIGSCIPADVLTPDQIRQFNTFNLDFVEIQGTVVSKMSEDQFNSLCNLLDECNLKSEVMNGFFPADVRMTGDDKDYEKLKSYLDNLLPKAKKLGCEFVVFGSPRSRNIPEGYPREKAWEELKKGVTIFSEKALPFGIRIGLEPLQLKGCNILNTVPEAVQMAKELNLKNVALIADYYQMISDDEPPENLVTYASFIEHIHMSERDRFFPRERGPDFDTFFEQIKISGYNKRISFEGKTNDFVNDLRVGVQVMRSYL